MYIYIYNNALKKTGDYLSLMSDSKTAGPVHRVQLPQQPHDHRSSFVLFYYPKFDANFADMARKVSSSRSREKAHQASTSSEEEEDARSLKVQAQPASEAVSGAAAATGGAVNKASPPSSSSSSSSRSAYNTMLDLAMKDPSTLDIPFGEYIMKKWSGVFKEA
jgi:hypothetical protein